MARFRAIQKDVEKVCVICGTSFYAKSNNAKCCSDVCRKTNTSTKYKEWVRLNELAGIERDVYDVKEYTKKFRDKYRDTAKQLGLSYKQVQEYGIKYLLDHPELVEVLRIIRFFHGRGETTLAGTMTKEQKLEQRREYLKEYYKTEEYKQTKEQSRNGKN